MAQHVYDITYIDFEEMKVRVWEAHCEERRIKAFSRVAFEAWEKAASILDAALHNASITASTTKHLSVVRSSMLYDALFAQYSIMPDHHSRGHTVCLTTYLQSLLDTLDRAAVDAVKIEADSGNYTTKHIIPVMVRPALEK